MKISWISIIDRIKYELKQREEEGNDVSGIKSEWEQISSSGLSDDQLLQKGEEFFTRIEESPSLVANIDNEPSDWDGITKICDIKNDNSIELSSDLINDKILGGWLGRSAGCLLGKPVEKTPRDGIKELLSSNNSYPIKDYITGIGIPDELLKKYPWNRHDGRESLKENIVCMNEDDDMNYPMLNLFVYEKYGRDFKPENVMQVWLELLPVLSVFTAERIAYINALRGINPPETAVINNPYKEWIGAQIRADLWGWVSPAQPAKAAELAWRDASISHVRNGIYGELLMAAATALAFNNNNIREIIEKALQYIPPKSRLAEAVKFVLSMPVEEQEWDKTVDVLNEKYGNYHWVHTINNASLVTAALLSSKGDFETAVCNVVMGGWDTDSNGATVGSIMGTMIGAENLPAKWIAPLKNRIRSSMKGFDNSLLSDLAERTSKLVNKN